MIFCKIEGITVCDTSKSNDKLKIQICGLRSEALIFFSALTFTDGAP
jgi:hypothetical protein